MVSTAQLDSSDDLDPQRREHVAARLHSNLMAWLTTVDSDGRPHSVPVWFLHRADGTILIYSRAGKRKLGAIRDNPYVSLGLDVTDIGRDVIRVEGRAEVATDVPPAGQVADYVAKYAERVGALFGTFDRFAAMFSVPIVITPARLYA